MKLCRDKHLKIVEHDTTSPALRIVVTHRSNDQYPEIKCPEKPQAIIEKVTTYRNSYLKKLNKINRLLRENKEVYWWGAGTLSVLLLNEIDSALIKKIRMVIDGDKRRDGFFIPGVNIRVSFYESIKGKRLDFLIINSEFHKEILEAAEKNSISLGKIKIFYD
jgi:hypothetical protein